MENRLKCVMMLSLKEMVLRRVAVHLWNDSQIPDPDFSDAAYCSWMNTHENKVTRKISKLVLPKLLRKEMIDKVRPISLEIRKWARMHRRLQISAREIGFEKIYWTSLGTIDYKKTAEALLSCEVLDAETRYKVASLYCLEDSIPLHWEGLAEDIKHGYMKKDLLYLTWFHPLLEFCWPRILKGEFTDLDRLWSSSDRNLTSFDQWAFEFTELNRLWSSSDRNLTSFNQWAFEYSARKGDKTAAEYFFLKLTHEEREVSLMRTTLFLLPCRPRAYADNFRSHYDVMCYLLSLMTPEQQMEATKKHPVSVLFCFYVMPWQDLLVENAGLVWPFLPTSKYGELSVEIMKFARSEEYHTKSFGEFFIMSPLEYKKHFVREYGVYGNPDYSFLVTFFKRDRAAIVLHPRVLDLLCDRDVQKTRRSVVEMCLQEAKLCKEDRERLKRERPDLRRVIEELYESDATAESERKGQKRKLESS